MKPFTPTYIDKQVARAAAALPAAGAWDAAPTAIFVGGADRLTLNFQYTRGGAAGAFDFEVLVSSLNPVVSWQQLTLYANGALAAGVDTQSRVQREYITYQATGAGAEGFVYGSIDLGGSTEWIMVAARESGNVGAPGALQIDVSLDWED